MREPGSLRWRFGLLCGLLWCAAVMLIDILTQPIQALNGPETVSFAVKAFSANLAGGMVWSLGAEWTANHQRKLAMFGLQLPVAVVALVAGANVPIQRLFDYSYSSDIGRFMGNNLPLIDYTCHAIWINVLCGGIYMLGFHTTNRAIKLRQHLTALRLASGEADMRLREMRLQAYQGQICPPRILEALKELRLRYSADHAMGEQLFDRLVDFLRAAMPGLRDSASTLSAEFVIIDAYAKLCNALSANCPRWQLHTSPQQTDASLSSSPLRLLTSLEQIDRCAPPGQAIQINTDSQGGMCGVKVRIGVTGLSNEERQQLKMRLETALGADAFVVAELPSDLLLDLRLPVRSVN